MKIPVTMQVQIAAGVVVVGVVAYLVWKANSALKKIPDNAQDAADGAAKALLDAAAGDFNRAIDIASGSVLGIGQAVGVPKTSVMLCSQAKALGNSLDASKYCTAAEYLSWQWDDLFSSGKVDFLGSVGGAGSNVVLGVGDAIGVPRTSVMLCSQAKALGNKMDASKYCTAADYLMWQLGRIFS